MRKCVCACVHAYVYVCVLCVRVYVRACVRVFMNEYILTCLQIYKITTCNYSIHRDIRTNT